MSCKDNNRVCKDNDSEFKAGLNIMFLSFPSFT